MTPTIALEQIISALETAKSPAPSEDQSEPSPPTATRVSHLADSQTLALSLSRVGTPSQLIRAGTLASLAADPEDSFGPPLHSVVIVGKRVHPMEIQYAAQWAGDAEQWWDVAEKSYRVVKEKAI